MVSAGPELMGERRRQLNLSGLYCTWWDKGALGLRQMPKLKLQTFGLPILILIQVSPWSQEEIEKADRTETYRTKGIIIQNVVVCLLHSRYSVRCCGQTYEQDTPSALEWLIHCKTEMSRQLALAPVTCPGAGQESMNSAGKVVG